MVHSGVVETRKVKHTSRVTKEMWLSRGGWRQPVPSIRSCTSTEQQQGQTPPRGHRHYSQKHRLPKQWTLLMGRKVWGTSTEANHRQCLAAWHWFQVGRFRGAVPGVCAPKLGDALLSRLLTCEMVVERGGCVFASLGNHSWAALLYPLHILHSDTNGRRTIRWGGKNSAVEFVHVVDASEWHVLSWTCSLAPAQGIVLQEVDEPCPLLKYSLREKSSTMSMDLLEQIAGCLDIPVQRDRPRLLRDLVSKVFEDCPNRDHHMSEILKKDTSCLPRTAAATLLEDPLFEAAWDEMGPDEQIEFSELRKEKTRGQVRRHIARHQQEAAQTRKRRRTRRPAERDEPVPAVEAVVQHDSPLAPAQGNLEEVAPVPPPPDSPLHQRRAGPAVPRGIPWGRFADGRPKFVLARTHASGSLKAITVTCHLHVHSGVRCNKSLTLGACFSEADAFRRVKAWCIAGLSVPEGDDARQMHMDPAFFNPRTVATEELQSLEEMDALVNQ